MSKGTVTRILGLALVASSAVALQLAAQDAPSVAEAARRARPQKQDASKPAKVITNDSLPAAPPSDSAAPLTPANNSTPASPDAAAGTETNKAPATPEEQEQKQQEIASLRKQITAKQDEINTQQGLIQLDQTTYYSNPDYVRDTAGKAKIDGEKAALDRLQQEMADLKAKLEDLGETVPSKPPARKK